MSRQRRVAIARRYFEVLELLYRRRRPLPGVDVMRLTSVSYAAIYVHLHRMQDFGWLHRSDLGYTLTPLGRAAYAFGKKERAK